MKKQTGQHQQPRKGISLEELRKTQGVVFPEDQDGDDRDQNRGPRDRQRTRPPSEELEGESGPRRQGETPRDAARHPRLSDRSNLPPHPEQTGGSIPATPPAAHTPPAPRPSAPVPVPAPATKTISAGLEPANQKMPEKEMSAMIEAPVQTAVPEEVTYSRLGDKMLERATIAAKAMADIKLLEKQILENPELSEVTLVRERLAAAYEVVDRVQIPPLVNKIRDSVNGQLDAIVAEATELGMKNVATATGPFTLYWKRQVYVAPRDNKAWESLMIELIKFANKAKAENRNQWNSGVTAMKAEAVNGPTLFSVGQGEPRDPSPLGKVYTHLPKKPGRDGKTYGEAHILVEVRMRKGTTANEYPVIVPVRALGRYERLFTDLTSNTNPAFLPVSTFRHHPREDDLKRLVQNLGEETGKRMYQFFWSLREALYVERDAAIAKAKATATAVGATEAPAEPTVVADPPAEGEARSDERPAATDDRTVESLGLPDRVVKALAESGITVVSQIPEDPTTVPGIGPKGAEEILKAKVKA